MWPCRIKENRLFAAAESNDMDLLEHCIERISVAQARTPRRMSLANSGHLDKADGKFGGGLLHANARRDFDYEERTELGGAAFHIALQNSHIEIAHRLLEVHPDYINMTFTGPLYTGQL